MILMDDFETNGGLAVLILIQPFVIRVIVDLHVFIKLYCYINGIGSVETL